jgi:hypothetical protein
VRASFLPVCSNLFEDGGTGENNGFPESYEMAGRVGYTLLFYFSNTLIDIKTN